MFNIYKIIIVFGVVLFFYLQKNCVIGIDDEYTIFNRFNQLAQGTFNSFLQNFNIEDKSKSNNVKIWCCKPKEIVCKQTFQRDKLIMEKLDFNNSIGFLIHGWTDSVNRTWMSNIIMDFAKYTNSNVCAVDWSYLALVDYNLAVKNTKIVANVLGEFITYLIECKFNKKEITLIGHSLGGQIAGYTGKIFNGKLSHIIALDPAGWLFTKPTALHPTDRLSFTDAEFVQCIHTDNDWLGIGSTFNDCHQDYYPNDGKSPQPGCIIPPLENGIVYLPSTCSHFKSVQYFQSSLNPNNKFKGTECLFGYKIWEMGLCNYKDYDYFGIYAKRTASGPLYLKTLSNPPYI